MRVRRARAGDAPGIHELIGLHSPDGTLLPRSVEDIQAHIASFVVAEGEGRLMGCGALYPYGNGLLEVRSVAVVNDAQGRGIGTRLVRRLLQETLRRQATRVFLFTRVPGFFSRLGFAPVPADSLPEKVWKDCCICPRRHCCDEIAMVYQPTASRHAWPDQSQFLPLRVLSG